MKRTFRDYSEKNNDITIHTDCDGKIYMGVAAWGEVCSVTLTWKQLADLRDFLTRAIKER